ncbi:hypothetical protein TIFTF001_033914 [Ficus carica]|uniref:Uncharacterized protein n=1 Tax=Ficus carica TaxID=3494 RepID=A0AA88JA05_FICCA|nr:hypothetical protein TIFTF001_033914 [Ficus carica]
MCKINKNLEEQIAELHNEKDVWKKAMINYEFLAVDKEMKFQKTRLELENTRKSLKMLNSDTVKLDHNLSIGKSSGDHHDLSYKGESSSSRTMFFRGTSIHEPSPESS